MTICPMFGDDCRHCSPIIVPRTYTEIKKDSRTGMFKPVRESTKFVQTGEFFCNNDGTRRVDELKYCPSRWTLHRGIVPIVEKPKRRCVKSAKKKPKMVKKPRTSKRQAKPKKPGRKTKAVKSSRTTRIAKTAKQITLGSYPIARNATQ